MAGKIVKVISVKINKECHKYPVYLSWLNKIGGISYWLFDKENSTVTRTKTNGKYQSNVTDLETATGNINMIGKSIAPVLEVGARISESDMDGIRSLYESGSVEMLINPLTWQTEGVKWQRVLVKSGSLLVLKTGTSALNVKLKLELPMINSQQE
ncbi:MAG: hypothetical protein HRT87_01210 [Legionellales bacterium]|nr:hypothetical protein [Legionellales bacterium]